MLWGVTSWGGALTGMARRWAWRVDSCPHLGVSGTQQGSWLRFWVPPLAPWGEMHLHTDVPWLENPSVLNKRYALRFRKCTLFKILEFFRCSLVQQESVTNAHICLFFCFFFFGKNPSPALVNFVIR